MKAASDGKSGGGGGDGIGFRTEVRYLFISSFFLAPLRKICPLRIIQMVQIYKFNR